MERNLLSAYPQLVMGIIASNMPSKKPLSLQEARLDTRQVSLFGEEHEKEIQRQYYRMTYTEWFHSIAASKITDRLFVGNVCNAAGFADGDNEHGITAVLNVSTEPPYPKHDNIVYMHVPFPDGEDIPPRQFAECIAFMKFCYENGHKIFVHCAAGMSRSPSILASFMHYIKLFEFDAGLEHIRSIRPVVMPAPAIKASCRRWLRIWPYDGSMGEAEPADKLDNTVTDVCKKQGTIWHSDPDCEWRQVYEKQIYIPNIRCICGKISKGTE
jgi:hypothetical protein